MEYQDGSRVEYGDIIYITIKGDKYVTVEEDSTTISLQEFKDNGKKQKVLVCGKKQHADNFYLTFKYSSGFLTFVNGKFHSGVPWTEKTLFSLDLLKEAVGSEDVTFVKSQEE